VPSVKQIHVSFGHITPSDRETEAAAYVRRSPIRDEPSRYWGYAVLGTSLTSWAVIIVLIKFLFV